MIAGIFGIFISLILATSSLARDIRFVHGNLQRRDYGYTQYNFTMPLDHFPGNPRYAPSSNATFEQHYWIDDKFYFPGGPVIVWTIGEDSSYDLTNIDPGLFHDVLNATGGLLLIWPQRYYSGGDIVPDYVYTTENLRFHSTQQAIADLAYFAQRISFPGHRKTNLTAPSTPWILIGGSYGGVISAFSRIEYPELFWGAIQSSGVSVGLNDFWEYYDAPRRYGPKDCISMQQKLIYIANEILTSNNDTQIQQLKSGFGVESLSNDNLHFLATALTNPMGNWQGRNWVPEKNTNFAGPGTFCANITSKGLVYPSNASQRKIAQEVISAGGFQNETKSLTNHVLNWFNSISMNFLYCPDGDYDACEDYANSPSPFQYLQCTESGQFASGYKPGTPGHLNALPVATTLESAEAGIEQCRKTYNFSSSYTGPNLMLYNQYGGVDMKFERLAITTGEKDVYRGVTPLALFLPGTAKKNPRLESNHTASEPQVVIANGGHEWDFENVESSEYNATFPPRAIRNVHAVEIKAIQLWLKEWNATHKA